MRQMRSMRKGLPLFPSCRFDARKRPQQAYKRPHRGFRDKPVEESRHIRQDQESLFQTQAAASQKIIITPSTAYFVLCLSG